MIYVSGEKPGKGTYQCLECERTVVIDNDMDKLPVCPKCGRTFSKKSIIPINNLNYHYM